MNVTQMTNAIVAAYPSRQPLMSWGAPGLGKSQGAAAAARILQKQISAILKTERKGQTKGEFGFIDLRLSLLEPIDLRGLPYIDRPVKGAVTTGWAPQTMLPTKGSAHPSHGILLLDEYVEAVRPMQAVARMLVLDRRIGEVELMDGWMVIGAGNRLGQGTASNAMPTNVANAFVHLDVEVSVDSWVVWALANDIDIRVVAFIKWRSPLLHQFDAKSKSPAFASPRSWAFVSKLLKTITDPFLLAEMIKGAVGPGPAAEFIGFLRVFDKLPSIEQILLNPKKAALPDDPATRYAVVTSLTSRINVDNAEKIITYLTRFTDEAASPEYSVAAMKEITMADDEREPGKKIGQTKAFITWAAKHHDVIV